MKWMNDAYIMVPNMMTKKKIKKASKHIRK
jgi:hypothetical protein